MALEQRRDDLEKVIEKLKLGSFAAGSDSKVVNLSSELPKSGPEKLSSFKQTLFPSKSSEPIVPSPRQDIEFEKQANLERQLGFGMTYILVRILQLSPKEKLEEVGIRLTDTSLNELAYLESMLKKDKPGAVSLYKESYLRRIGKALFEYSKDPQKSLEANSENLHAQTLFLYTSGIKGEGLEDAIKDRIAKLLDIPDEVINRV